MITRWDPFREMVTMRRAMDRLMEGSVDDNTATSQWALPLDVVENEDGYVVRASVPGLKPDDIEVTYDKGMLTIRGEIKDDSEAQKGQYHLRERRFGMFSRTISLPTSIKADSIQAAYQEGVLMLTLPKEEEVKPRRISVQVANGQKVLDQK